MVVNKVPLDRSFSILKLCMVHVNEQVSLQISEGVHVFDSERVSLIMVAEFDWRCTTTRAHFHHDSLCFSGCVAHFLRQLVGEPFHSGHRLA